MTLARPLIAAFAFIAALPAIAFADDVAVIVTFHGHPDVSVLAKHGGTVDTDLSGLGAVAGRVPASRLRALRAESGVARVEEDLVRQASVLTPNDTYYGSYQADDFGLIRCPEAWSLSTGANVRVAVLDTGVQTNHPDLTGKIKASRNFTGGKSSNVGDQNGHGTHTAGTVGANMNNNKGVASAGYKCELAIGKVLGPSGGYDSWVAAGIDWAWQGGGSRVISMSLGGVGTSSVLDTAISRASTADVVIVAAAGNSGADMDDALSSSLLEFPAANPLCISVAAVSSSGSLAPFSNYGTTVDIAAPGVDIASTYKGSGYALMSGTSMSTPHVAGVVALVRSKYPALSNLDVRARIEGSATIEVPVLSGSLKVLDAAAALQ